MPTEYFLDSYRGHDSNSGTHRKAPKQTWGGLMMLGLKPGDIVRIRMGSLFDLGDKALAIQTNGVTYTTYSLGSERAQAPQIRTSARYGLLVQGKDNTFEDLEVWDAAHGVVTDPGCTGNTFTRVHVRDFALGFVDKSGGTTFRDCYAAGGRMLRNEGKDTDVGASALTLWREPGYEHRGTCVYGLFAEDCRAPSTMFGYDGSLAEFFGGGIQDVMIDGLTGLDFKIAFEFGSQTALREMPMSNIRICNSLTMGGRIALWNGPDKDFYAPFEGIVFEKNTFLAHGDSASPFFWSGNHGSLKGKVSFIGNVITGDAQIFNADSGTKLDFERRDNRFYRPDGGKGVGGRNGKGDAFGSMADFHAPDFGDYRLRNAYPNASMIGALGAGTNISDMDIERRRAAVNQEYFVGRYSVPSYRHMLQLNPAIRKPGLLVDVRAYRLRYELQPDLKTWLKVGRYE